MSTSGDRRLQLLLISASILRALLMPQVQMFADNFPTQWNSEFSEDYQGLIELRRMKTGNFLLG
jgi:predicted lipase